MKTNRKHLKANNLYRLPEVSKPPEGFTKNINPNRTKNGGTKT